MTGKIRIAGLTGESVVDGPGFRLVIFAQGCPHHCRGCHNPDTWDPGEGYEVTAGEILKALDANPLLKGITLSGGEPFLQPVPLAQLAMEVKQRGLDIVVYTGYTWEVLQERAARELAIKRLLEYVDFLVDGPYIDDLRDMSLPFRGSSNQRVIDVKASLVSECVVTAPW